MITETVSFANDFDLEKITELEKILSTTIPEVEIIQYGKSGYKMNNGFVTEISIIGLASDELFTFICEFLHLERVILQKNKITTIPKEITRLENLVYLDIKHNYIDYVLNEVLELPRLKYLDISYNQLKSFMTFEQSFPALEVLILDHNYLEEVFFSINSCPTLYECYVNNNKLISISIEFLLSLKQLALQNNRITNVPKIENLSNLETIEMHYNEITKIDIDFANLQALQHISLSYNKITELDFINFANSKIKYFFIYGNPLDKYSRKKFNTFMKKRLSCN